MTPDRSNPLHNFNLPSRLRWGKQRYLRCKKLEDDVPERDRGQRLEGESRIEAIGEKLMLDFKQRMENLKVVGCTVEREKSPAVDAADEVGVEKVDGESSRPWNLRTRRSPALGPIGKKKGVTAAVAVGERSSPVKRVRGAYSDEVEMKVRVPLKREEIEEDFLMMAGIKPARRPKKRPKAVQKELDVSFG